MNYKDPKNDSGSYQGTIYTTKNGYAGSGLNCPKGARLYDIGIKPAAFFVDNQEGEKFVPLSDQVAKDVMPYYAISNYGRIVNMYTSKVMKPNYRPNGYEYYCLAASNAKTNQKKYSTHRLVMETFRPVDNMDQLEVNHIFGDKTLNYVDKPREDGTLEDSLEWATSKENVKHAFKNGLHEACDATWEEAKNIRILHDNGYSYEIIKNQFYPRFSTSYIQRICRNKIFVDPNYQSVAYGVSHLYNPANAHRLTEIDADKIRELHKNGLRYEEIKDKYYPDFSIAAISDICRYKTHYRDL